MTDVVFVGDEVTAAGYRLCGARVSTPPLRQAADAVRRALRETPTLVLVGAEYAARLPPTELDAALLAQRPPLLVVGDLCEQVATPDLGLEIARVLGLASLP